MSWRNSPPLKNISFIHFNLKGPHTFVNLKKRQELTVTVFRYSNCTIEYIWLDCEGMVVTDLDGETGRKWTPEMEVGVSFHLAEIS